MVHWSQNQPGVLGARMMGGGFGGCTLNLIHQDQLADWTLDALETYRQAYDITGAVYRVDLSDGICAGQGGFMQC